VIRLNRQLVGWANYFCLGTVAPAWKQVIFLYRALIAF